ncbi:hypothetical protein DCAR_0205405 [Daucus carota subsp. sativus]|uniref:Wax synthase domain-containing protein n=1 Tax=Daucus carota subsp. sativus TaxID=79200 RepID=A0AAF1AK54_DAUCS|nr:PREDICTED: long-chain-alcohol O-fatty-acyltransferase-like [Daucus carota subsp. sativus]WOG86204.1 hypothetical protein DCAR_0205405 [Daucus carota subsp. sativus]
MEGELNNFAMVWITVLASLCHCHTIAKFIPKGTARFLAILPISILFIFLPLNLTTVHLGVISSFFIAWLANSKILLFAFGQGPLSTTPPMPLSRFLPLACLPIKIHVHHSNNKHFKETSAVQIRQKQIKSSLNCLIKIGLLGVLKKIYGYRQHFHYKVMTSLYCLHLYLSVELMFAMLAALARILMRVKLEPQFDEPYLATSLQDFWGRRWNLMVSDILKPSVFQPTREIFSGLVGRKWATFVGVIATFLVSGLMHELFFYTYGRQKTRWEVTRFFLLHGVSLSIEVVVKKMVKGKFRLPAMVSRPLTIMYVVITSCWLFFPAFLRGNAEAKVCNEYRAFLEFVQNGRVISPNVLSCT